ncbi:MAG: septation protein SpoVG family protein [Candidatus Omnitrophica bacterium]|nr:septation protein SpoVG family protein [Candidatus Omnitrophota bacterium]MDD5672306.1 septation protein SpoVG family protein [Candidatus Omnitrophota bacterium]
MKVTEVRIFPKETGDKKLLAFATITFDDCFVVRDLKIIEGSKGIFVAMPSRRVKVSCPKCGHRNVVHSQFCNQCGGKLDANLLVETSSDDDETKLRQSEHKDIAHPITAEFREYIQKTVLDAYRAPKGPKPKS